MRRFFFGLAVFALAAPVPLLAETTDRQIAQQIVKQLKSQKEAGQLKGFNLDLQVEEGAVYLSGFVTEPEQRRKAVDAARRVEGVTQVFNEIEIKPSALKPLSEPKPIVAADTSKAKDISETLATAPQPPAVDVEAEAEPAAETADISTMLTGVVTNQAPVKQEDDGIPENVFRTPQLATTNDAPVVQPAATPQADTSREIADKLIGTYRQAMEQGDLDGFGVDVQVDQGIVELNGTVADAAQMNYAIEVARHIRGVKEVVNGLDITPAFNSQLVSHEGSDEGVQHAFRQQANQPAGRSEAERIAKEVVAGLQQQKAEGLLSNFGIDVQVDQRVVWMSGYVKNAEQHARALEIARYVPGVEKVVNDLQIREQATTLRPVNATATPAVPAAGTVGQAFPGQQLVPVQYLPAPAVQPAPQTPVAFAPARPVNHTMVQPGQPVPMTGNAGVGIAPARFDHPQMPGYAWPSYAAYPNYGAVTYPKQYSASAWPYIGPFYPYPQVPLGWRRVTLEWDDGWWNLKFKNTHMH